MIPIFLSKDEQKKIREQLKEFGIKEIPFLLLKLGKDRIRAYSGSFDREEVDRICKNVFVELVGLYFGKFDGDELRLSIDALHLLKRQVTKKIIHISGEQKDKYFLGEDVDVNDKQKEEIRDAKGYFVIKCKEDILGMAKIVNGQIKNYLPKERRRR